MKKSIAESGMSRLLACLPEGGTRYELELPESGSWPKTPHSIGEREALAIVAAVGAGRPLLVEGEPGVGKSQLARAAAELLDWHFISTVIQPDTEYRDLLWLVDHTERLGRAQLLAHEKNGNAEKALSLENFVSAGPLWWAFDYGGEKPQGCGYQPEEALPSAVNEKISRDSQGVVLLIDEIDKADIALCNGLLEALGNNGFRVPPLNKTVSFQDKPPLVVVTSNQTRHLPPAFLRRCVRITLNWPDEFLESIGQLHFESLDPELVTNAADLIRSDRRENPEPPKSGLAEYLDLLRAIAELGTNKSDQQLWLEKLGQRFLKGATR